MRSNSVGRHSLFGKLNGSLKKAFVLLLFIACSFKVMERIVWHQSKSHAIEMLTQTQQKYDVGQFTFDAHHQIDRDVNFYINNEKVILKKDPNT
jgi:hypothetical protein